MTRSLTEDIMQEKIKYEDVNIQELDKRLSSMCKNISEIFII